MAGHKLIQQLYKTEYRRIVSVLCNFFGTYHIALAEDIANDTFLLAIEHWEQRGLPENPAAWLYTVAKNKAKDSLNRKDIFDSKVAVSIKQNAELNNHAEVDFSEESFSDSQLKMLFAICDPLIPQEAQLGLALRILCGFSIDEIASTFLSNKETINKRLHRAKEKLREGSIQLELPDKAQLNQRLDTVLMALYLLFNEGYHSTTNSVSIRRELCMEAMRLCLLLLNNKSTNLPPTNALMSLMCFHASRFDARVNDEGGSVLYNEQDRTLWNEDLINRGNYYIIESAQGSEISKFHLEASIGYWHTTKTETADKWQHILQLYNKLLQIDYSPMAALNRTYALYRVHGKQVAITEAEKLKLESNHMYHMLLGYLYTDDDKAKALHHYSQALQYAKSSSDKETINKYIGGLM